MSRPRAVRWARRDTPIEATEIDALSIHANDQIWKMGGKLIGSTDVQRESAEWRRQTGRYDRSTFRSMLIYPSPAHTDDPLTVMLVSEQLLLLNWDSYITAVDLSDMLAAHYPQVRWNQWIVGNVMSRLAEICLQVNQPGFPPGRSEHGGASPHIMVTKRHGLNNYTVTPTMNAWYWLRQVRRLAGDAAKLRAEGADKDLTLWDDLGMIAYNGAFERVAALRTPIAVSA